MALVLSSCGSPLNNGLVGSCEAGPCAVDGSYGFTEATGPRPDFGWRPTPDGGTAGGGGDPTTCAQAAMFHTYMGCDYWPTVTTNSQLDPTFDFAVVVSNVGTSMATVKVTGPGSTNQTVAVAPNSLSVIYLPWVANLLQTSMLVFGIPVGQPTSVLSTQGAYHLVSDVPVVVYQFNALEYQSTGGPPGKNWSTCMKEPGYSQCYSFTNDASLLLPSTAMTGDYVVSGARDGNGTGFFAITATQNATTVKVKLASTAGISAGTGVTAAAAGSSLTYTLNAGDVLEAVSDKSGGTSEDLSGSQVQASKPVQIIAGNDCMYNPDGVMACDHLEQSMLPIETLGKHYFVTRPTGPNGNAPGVTVRFYGVVNGTNLKYPTPVAGAPATLNAGQVVEIPQEMSDFEVTGDQEFAITTVQWGGTIVSSCGQEGDPSLSNMVTVEQYRKHYVFLAPTDYDFSYADVVEPSGTTLTLDGAAVTTAPTAISSGYGVVRIKLGAGAAGAHVLTASQPVGLQVIGYGMYTSYQYPGGLNLAVIAPCSTLGATCSSNGQCCSGLCSGGSCAVP